MARYKKDIYVYLIPIIVLVLAFAVGLAGGYFFTPSVSDGDNTSENGQIITDKNNGATDKNDITQPDNSLNGSNSTNPQKPVSYEERVGKEYTVDIEKYLEYIEPENKYEYVFLVNPTHPLTSDYAPDDLMDCGHTRKDGRATQKLREDAAMALRALLEEGRLTGEVTNVTVTSAYRSYSYQNELFTYYFNRDWATGKFATKEECEKYTLSYSTKPGTSEHQSGLAVDMHNLPSAEDNFAFEPEAKWLAENAHRFGFILRYPDGKTDITGIKYEPWHFRFVGREAATEIYEKGLTLEEYIEQKANEIAAEN